MGLLELTTNLRSLKYGRDQKGGGSSQQPFIQTPIPGYNEESNSNSTDFLLRNGALSRSVTDLDRISKFLTTVDGVLFIAKQSALSLQNPLVLGRPNRTTPVGGQYNPFNTLDQVAGNALGFHTEKQGLFPINDPQEKYFSIVKSEYNTTRTNRLSILYNTKILETPDTVPDLAAMAILGIDPLLPTNLIKYVGGAQSPVTSIKITNPTINNNNLPNGETLKTYQVGTAPFTSRGGFRLGGEGINIAGASAVYFIYDEINGNVIGDPELETLTGITPSGQQTTYYGPQDDNSTLSTNTKGLDLKTYQAEKKDIEFNLLNTLGVSQAEGIEGDNNLGINEEGQQLKLYGPQDNNSTLSKDNKGQILKTYQVGLENSLTDRTNSPEYTTPDVNTGNPLTANAPARYRAYALKKGLSDPIGLSVSTTQRDSNLESEQICKFFFEIINNETNGSSEFIYFRAYINDLKDTYSGEWSDVRYSGRAEKFYQYKGFNRDISIGFQLVAHTEAELDIMYQKMNKLTNMVTPDYSDLGYMRGTLVRLTVGDYFQSLPGIVKGIDFSGHFDTGWEIVNGRQVPKYLTVGGIQFSPIHDFLPQKGAQFYNVASA